MKSRGYLTVLFVCSFSIMGGCATLTTGNSQSITIDTKPQGATCTLTRDGKAVAVVNPTPGTVSVDKSKYDISVICMKEGFQDGATVCPSSLQGMTFGNILFGGLIGIAIDAGTGAMNKYPSMLTVALIPTEFNSVADRDVFFDNMKAECIEETSKAIAQLSESCTTTSDDQKALCLNQIKAAETARESRLSELETMRTIAKIKQLASVSQRQGIGE